MDEFKQQALSLLASQGELVGSITHDLKGLLSGVEGGIYLVNSGLKKENPERVENGIQMMQRSLDRIKRTVASSLYYVKDREKNWVEINARDIVFTVKKELQEQARHLGVNLEIKPGSISFEADEFAILSVVSNLVEYSIEACQIAKLKPSPTVTLTARGDEEHVLFEVFVDGFAMQDQTLNLTLATFYMPKGVDRSHLPLFVAHKILKNHRGTLKITSSTAKGSTHFIATLPKEKPDDIEADSLSQSEKMLANEWDGDAQ